MDRQAGPVGDVVKRDMRHADVYDGAFEATRAYCLGFCLPKLPSR